MTLQKTKLLCLTEYDRIFKMHVYILVWLKSDQIGFLIVGLKHLDYSTASRITRACIHSIRLDLDFVFCTGSRFFFPGPWAESRRTVAVAASFLQNHCKQECYTVHLVCVIIMCTIYEMYKVVASSCSSYAIFLQWWVCCCWWCKEVSRRRLYYH